MKHYSPFFILILLALWSCSNKDEGCTDPKAANYNPLADIDDSTCYYHDYGCTDQFALNYNEEATADDGSCTYPTRVYVDNIILEEYPSANPQGTPWDASSGPDCYIVIADKNDSTLLKTGVSLAPWPSWDTALIIEDLNQSITLSIYDDDGSTSEFMCSLNVNLHEYTKEGTQAYKYPGYLPRDSGGCSLSLSLEWY